MNRFSGRLILAVTSMITSTVLAVAVTDVFAGHALAAESQVDWKARLAKVHDAVGRNDIAGALSLWREAYAAALRSRHWEGLVAVGDVHRRLGDLGRFREAAEVKAREIYFAALFRARQEASLDGVLRTAEAFAELGDARAVEQCLKVAGPLAAETRDARAEARIRAFAERWGARTLEVERQNEPGTGGSVQ